MCQTVLDTERVPQYFAEVLDRWLKASALKGSKQSQEPIAGYDQVRLECTRLFTEGKGNDLPTVKGTLWAAYGAVVEYVDYHELKIDAPKYLNRIWYDPLKIAALNVARQMIPSTSVNT